MIGVAGMQHLFGTLMQHDREVSVLFNLLDFEVDRGAAIAG